MKEFKTGLLYDPEIPVLSIYKNKQKNKQRNANLKRYLQTYAHCSIIYNSWDLETTQMRNNREVNKEVIHYSAIIKDKLLFFASK